MKYLRCCSFTILILFSFINVNTLFAQDPKLILQTGNTNRIDDIEFDPSGKYILTTFGSEVLHLWEVSSGRILNSWSHEGRITHAGFFPKSSRIAVSTTAGMLYFWKFRGSGDNFVLSGHRGAVTDFGILEDESMLISCGEDSTLRIWNLNERKEKSVIKNSYNPFECIEIAENSSLLFAGDRSGNLLILNYRTGKEEYYHNILNTGIRDMNFNTGTNELAIADNRGKVDILSLEPVVIKFSVDVFEHQAYSITYLDDRLIVTGRDPEHNLRFLTVKNDSLVIPPQNLFHENNTDPDFIYGIYDHALSGDNLLAVPSYDGSFSIYDLEKEKFHKDIKGLSSPINDFSLNKNELLFATGNELTFYDLKGIQPMLQSLKDGGVRKVLTFDDTFYSIYNRENELQIFNTGFSQPVKKIKLPTEANLANVVYRPEGKEIIYRRDNKKVSVKNIESGKIKKIKIPLCNRIITSQNSSRIAFLSDHSEIIISDTEKYKTSVAVEDKSIRAMALSFDGNLLAYFKDLLHNRTLKIMDLNTGKNKFSLSVPDTVVIDQLYFFPDNSGLVSFARSVGKYNQREDYSLTIWSLDNALDFETRLVGHSGFISGIEFSDDGRFLFSSGTDGTIRCWSLTEMQEKASFIPFNDGEWVVLSPEGRFDASPKAMTKLHYVFKNEFLHLDQMKENFYEPKLLQKILGYSSENLISNAENNRFELYPEIRLTPPQFNNGILEIKLKNQGGGIGETSVRINDKEVIEDIRLNSRYDSSEHKFSYSVSDHPYLKRGELNKITVETSNDTGYRISKKRNVYLIDDRKKSDIQQPHLYLLSIGISDYTGELIDLNFAAKDATDFAAAVKLGAVQFLGENNVHIYEMTTDQEDQKLWPVKANIEKTILEISNKANPNDILIVYLSGHGLDKENDDEFYFLTAEAENPMVTDEKALKNITISSSELIRMIKLIPALKQLLIVDACHSGNLVTSSFVQNGSLNSKSIKALEYMKDRTGTYILASSEGAEVSYESNALNQGLLTYSLLFGMKGAGLLEGDMIDVANLLQFVNKNVPDLAGEIGRSQKPVIKVPVEARSFQIGKLSHEVRERINIAPPKPIIVRSHFQNENKFIDDRHFSINLDSKIREIRDNSDQSFIFLDESEFSNAYAVYGRYTVENNNQIRVSYRIFKNDKQIFSENFQEISLSQAIEKIAGNVIKVLSENEGKEISINR